jgi:hypothetical protein
MNSLNYIKSIFILTILIIVTSCSEPCDEISCLNDGICVEGICECPDGFTGENCEIQILRLKKRTQINGRSYEVMYNADGYISNDKIFENGTDLLQESSYVYSLDTLFQTIDIPPTSPSILHKIYRQSSNELINERYQRNGSIWDLQERKTTTYNSNCGPTEATSLFPNGLIAYSQTWEYNEENCSMNTTTLTPDNTLVGKAEASKADGNNPYHYGFDYFIEFPNSNYKSVTNYSVFLDPTGETITNSSSFTSEFQFNDDNYPISETRTYLNGNIEEFTFEYY